MSMQRGTREKINEWVVWFNWHADKVSTYPQDQQIKWLLKAVNGAYECMTLIGREQDNTGKLNIPGFDINNGLLVPRTWSFNGKR